MDNLEAIRYVPKEGNNKPAAWVKLSPTLAYGSIWFVGKFEPKYKPPAHQSSVLGPRSSVRDHHFYHKVSLIRHVCISNASLIA